MTIDTIITIAVSIAVSLLTSALYISWQLGQYKNKVDTLETTVGKDEHNGLRKTVGDIRDKVIACQTSLRERGPLLQAQSPVALTDRGTSFLQDSGSKKFVDDNFEELLQNVEKLDPKTAYDVQEDAKKVIEELRGDERLNPIKDFLFKDGSSMDDAVAVMGVYLRDKVLEHKKWRVEDVDGHEDSNLSKE